MRGLEKDGQNHHNNNNNNNLYFKSQIVLAEHECSTNWGDCKSNKL